MHGLGQGGFTVLVRVGCLQLAGGGGEGGHVMGVNPFLSQVLSQCLSFVH